MGQPGWRRLGPGKGLKLVVKDLSGSMSLSFKSLERENFPPTKLSDDLLMPVASGNVSEPHAALTLQLTLIEDGALLSLCFSHAFTDGTGMTTITSLLAQFCHKAHSSKTAMASLSTVRIDNSALVGLKSPKNHWEDHAACIPIEPMGPVDESKAVAESTAKEPATTIRIYRISENSLAKLKNAATRDRISTNDALFALIWRLVIRVRIETGILCDLPDFPVHMLLAVGTRKHLGLDAKQIGNMVYMVMANIPISTLLGSAGLVEAAAKVRAAVNGVTRDSMIGLHELLEGMPRLGMGDRSNHKRNHDVVVTPMSMLRTGESLLRDVWGPAFGGRAVRLRCGDKGFLNDVSNGQFILPLRPDGQGAEMQFELQERGFEVLESDPLFAEYFDR